MSKPLSTPNRMFVIEDAEGRLIGVDHKSGGYPFIPLTAREIYFWSTRTGAENYAETFRRGTAAIPAPWSVKEVSLVEIPVMVVETEMGQSSQNFEMGRA